MIAYLCAIGIVALIYCLLALGLNLQFGLTRLVNFGVVAFFAVGAYTSGLLALQGVPLVLCFVAAGLLAGVLALPIGLLSLRLRDDYLAIVTLGFSEAVRISIQQESWLTKGVQGLPGLPKLFASWGSGVSDMAIFATLLALVALVAWGTVRLAASPFGRLLKAIGDDEAALSALGKDPAWFKVQVFMLGAVLAGLAGAFYAHFITFITPEQFIPLITFYVWMGLVMGGSGTVRGAVFGSLLLMVFLEGSRFAKDWVPGLAATPADVGPGGGGPGADSGHAVQAQRPVRWLGSNQMTTMLKVDAVTRLFGGFKAVDGVSLQLKAGEILGIAGTNGAGKSTLFAAIAGQQPADAGQIEFDGQDITRIAPYRRARLGLVRTFQIPREFKSLTVHENLLAAAANPQGERLLNAFFQTRSRREHEAQLADKADRILQFLNLARVRDVKAGGLSGGQKKLVELGRVLMLDPRCILLDEPFAGVNPVLIEEICDRVRELNGQGIAFIVIEHHLQALKSLSHRMIVMDRGCILAEGDPHTVLDDPRVQEAYMGGVV